jgi:hypothetical protein
MPIDLMMAAAPRPVESYASSPELALVDADLAASLRLALSDLEHHSPAPRRVSTEAVDASNPPERLDAGRPDVLLEDGSAGLDPVPALVEEDAGSEVGGEPTDVLHEASSEGGHRGSMPALPSPQAEGLDVAEATEAALKRIRERLGVDSQTAPKPRRFHHRVGRRHGLRTIDSGQ